MKTIPFHRPFMDNDEIEEITDSLQSGWWTMGPKTVRFEQEFAKFLGVDNAVSASSWTGAGHLALEAIGLTEGDEVILPPLTFIASAEIVTYFKAKPVLVDINPDNLGIDASKIEEKITPHTKAIMPVHYSGIPCDMDEIRSIASAHNLRVLEDAAHAFPSFYKGQIIGKNSDITVFSFYATKTLATGEGGMIVSSDDEIVKRCRYTRLHGMSKDAWLRNTDLGSWSYDVVAQGYKYNFTDINAALGIAQLKKAHLLYSMRKYISDRYNNAFSQLDFLTLVPKPSDRQSSLHLYPIILRKEALTVSRTQFIEELKKLGILTTVHFIPVYRFSHYSQLLKNTPEEFPETERFFEGEISLPIFPGMTDDEIDRVIDAVITIGKKNRR